MSANLKAPLVFNLSNRLGKQVVLKDPQYQTKHFIMEEMKLYTKRVHKMISKGYTTAIC